MLKGTQQVHHGHSPRRQVDDLYSPRRSYRHENGCLAIGRIIYSGSDLSLIPSLRCRGSINFALAMSRLQLKSTRPSKLQAAAVPMSGGRGKNACLEKARRRWM